MKNNYSDIISKAGQPLWFDENGVPRYVEFHPFRCVNKSAKEAFLIEVKCQTCGTSFLVAKTWDGENNYFYGVTIPPYDKLTAVNGKNLHYGDPPNISCCPAGPTMSSEFYKIIQAWIRTEGPSKPWMQLDQEAIDSIGAKSEVYID